MGTCLFQTLSSVTQISLSSKFKAFASATSTKVLEAIDEYKDSLLSDGMNWELWMKKVNDAKAKFAQLINCNTDEVAIMSSVSDCISSVLNYY